MPNGHSGVPKWTAPVVLLALTVVSLLWFSRHHGVVFAVLSLLFAGGCARALAFVLTMRDAADYGGIYTPVAELDLARSRYRRWSTVLIISAVALVGVALRLMWGSS